MPRTTTFAFVPAIAKLAMNAALWNVTIPIDSSVSSRRGVAYALELGLTGAILHFCSVVDATDACLGGASGAMVDPAPIVRAMLEDAQHTCDDAVAQASQRGISADGKVVFGVVAPAIRRFVQDRTSNALVIGTHARTSLARAFIGSTAERLMQTSPVPVVVTHADDIAGSGPIAVAVDGTPAANAALLVAIDLARVQRCGIVIINVVKGGPKRWLASLPILNDAADVARSADVDFELLTREGPAADTIITAAQRQRSPMIVIGASGQSDICRALVGSVAAAVVEHAHVPVTVVRES